MDAYSSTDALQHLMTTFETDTLTTTQSHGVWMALCHEGFLLYEMNVQLSKLYKLDYSYSLLCSVYTEMEISSSNTLMGHPEEDLTVVCASLTQLNQKIITAEGNINCAGHMAQCHWHFSVL